MLERIRQIQRSVDLEEKLQVEPDVYDRRVFITIIQETLVRLAKMNIERGNPLEGSIVPMRFYESQISELAWAEGQPEHFAASDLMRYREDYRMSHLPEISWGWKEQHG